ncbi:MAG: hypothetical protein RBT41_09400 [Clostridia bacterium]|jgi:dephospho-CoA kinase|nr:hypothetical protein [Clostridia bacterium]
MELHEILKQHCCKYPRLQSMDAVKLVYQNEFGAGHFVKNEAESLALLREEWENACLNQEDVHEDIGNGLCRLNLAGAKACKLDVSTLNRIFMDTANTPAGTIPSLESKLALLSSLCADRVVPLDNSELEQTLAQYRKNGYPSVHHSEVYRQCYAPAYRVVKKTYCDFLSLFIQIDRLLRSKRNPLIAIDGNAAAGKSTLADALSRVYDCNVIRMDHFFLPPNKRNMDRLNEIGGNIDYERFYDQVISRIFQGQEFSYPIYDCRKMDYSGSAKVNPQKMTVIEGVYSLHPYFGNVYDLKVFLTADPETQKLRIHKRSGAERLDKFVALWIPQENKYFDTLKISEKCDCIF